jgi:hypothetical protein
LGATRPTFQSIRSSIRTGAIARVRLCADLRQDAAATSIHTQLARSFRRRHAALARATPPKIAAYVEGSGIAVGLQAKSRLPPLDVVSNEPALLQLELSTLKEPVIVDEPEPAMTVHECDEFQNESPWLGAEFVVRNDGTRKTLLVMSEAVPLSVMRSKFVPAPLVVRLPSSHA